MKEICYRDKEAHSAYEMFHTRYRLYRMACFHPVTVAVNIMICDALVEAAPYLTLTKPNGEKFDMLMILKDMEAYRMLDDTILGVIRRSHGNVKLTKARTLLERIQKRELYKLIRRIKLEKDAKVAENDVKLEDIVKQDNSFKLDDMCFKIVTLDYGMGAKNPVDKVLFYSKRDPEPRPIPQDEVSHLLPKTFQERQLFIYVKDSDKKEVASKCVDEWAQHQTWIPKREPETPSVSKAKKIKCPPSTSEKRDSVEEGSPSETKRAMLQEDEH
ncbi:deoxynucleoside triphosphate triphosphohydrolase SAMHD1-like [Ptychodera flava]|uniref:deoxynucleoside triphosphate triphosphohydrolase SAMHD1-like n=1 Tax=Ptychodera flava TaxID=63121 RepID=UPI003969EB1E